jgi:hypothetical protein
MHDNHLIDDLSCQKNDIYYVMFKVNHAFCNFSIHPLNANCQHLAPLWIHGNTKHGVPSSMVVAIFS